MKDTDDRAAPDAEKEVDDLAQLPVVVGNGADLSGQYYIHLVYSAGKRHLLRSAVVNSRRSLFDLSEGKNVKGSEGDAQLTSLLDEHKKISGYASIGHQASSEISSLSTLRLKYELEQEVDSSLIRVKKRGRSDLFVSKTLDVKNAKKSIEKYWHSVAHGYSVQNAIFVGMVTTFDELVAQLIRNVLKHVPEILNSFSLEIPYRDVVSAKDFQNLQESLIRDIVDGIMWKSRSDQLKWLETYVTKEKFLNTIPQYEKFIEIAERRNVYVHNNGIVNSAYLSRVNIEKAGIKDATLGKRLHLTSKYFDESADVLVEAYVIIVHKVIRKLMRNATLEQKEVLDTHFNQSVYDQLDGGRFDSAARLASKMLDGGFAISDMTRKMGAVNLGIALKKSGDELSSNRALDSVDWSSARTEFKLCIAAIKEDEGEVCRLLPQMIGSDLIGPQAYFEWPAFEWMRSKPKFWQKLQEVYGDTIRRGVDDPVHTM